MARHRNRAGRAASPPGDSRSGQKAAGMAATAAMLAALTAPPHAAAERLEVRSTKPDGEGSLIQAIRQSNSDPDRDRIVFADRLHGVIDLDRGLRVTVPVKID